MKDNVNEERLSGIYVWKLNGISKYVGKGIDVHRRMNQKHTRCIILNNGINKHGWNAFEREIIEYCSEDKLNEREIYWIKELDTRIPNGYNMTYGGDGNSNPSEETREKMRKNHADISGKNNFWFGKHLPEETKRKISENHADFSGENSSLFGVKHDNTSSKYYGVYKSIGKNKYVYWMAKIGKIFISQSKSEIDSAKAYDKYVIENKLNRPLNFPIN